MVTYDVRVDWAGNGSFDDVGDDVTARVFDRGTPVQTRVGRDQARALSPIAPGRAQLELDNRSRDYSPENTSSPLAGNVRPARDMRMQATLNSITYGLFRGFTDDFTVLPDLEQRSVQITCTDTLAKLKDVRITTGLYDAVQTGQAIGLLLDAVGWSTTARDLDVGASTLPWWWVDDTDAYTALQSLLDSEGPGSLATVDVDGSFVFRDRHHRLIRSASMTSQATWRSAGVEPLISPPMVYDQGWKDIVNSVLFTVPVRSPSPDLTAVWSFQGQQAIADGQTIPISATASEPFTGAVVPEQDTDYTLLSGTVSMRLSRTSGQSATVFVTASSGPAVIQNLQLRAYAVAAATTVQVSADESTSISRYGRRSWPSGRDPVYASLTDAIAIADIILANRAERLPTITVTMVGANDTRLTQQLVRDLSDRVTVVDAETGLNADCYVEQIEHNIGQAGLNHITRFGLEKVPTLPTGVLILDDGTLGLLNTGTLGGIGLSDPSTVYVLDASVQGKLDTGILGF